MPTVGSLGDWIGLVEGISQPFQAYFTSGLICNGPTILIAYSWRELERVSPLGSRACPPTGSFARPFTCLHPSFPPPPHSAPCFFAPHPFDNPQPLLSEMLFRIIIIMFLPIVLLHRINVTI